MLIAYLVCWAAAIACATVGCLPAALVLVIVLIGIIFRWELVRLARLLGPHLPLARRPADSST